MKEIPLSQGLQGEDTDCQWCLELSRDIKDSILNLQ